MDLVRRLAARAAVVEELPGGPGLADVGGGHALIAAVVVLQQQVAGAGVGKPGQGGGAAGALEGAGVDGGEVEAAQALAELAGPCLALGEQREVGAAGVALRLRPLGLAVAGQVEG